MKIEEIEKDPAGPDNKIVMGKLPTGIETDQSKPFYIRFENSKDKRSSFWHIESSVLKEEKISNVEDILKQIEDLSGIRLHVCFSILCNIVFVSVSRDKIEKILSKLKTQEEFFQKDSLIEALEKISQKKHSRKKTMTALSVVINELEEDPIDNFESNEEIIRNLSQRLETIKKKKS